MASVLVKIRKNYSKILSGNPKVIVTCATNHCGSFHEENSSFQYLSYYQKYIMEIKIIVQLKHETTHLY